MLALDEALAAFAQIAPRQAKVVELRYFGGLNEEGNRRGPQSVPSHGPPRLGIRPGLARPGTPFLICATIAR
jgi:hypothetical protein